MNKLAFTQVSIDGFRGLKKLQLDQLGPLNILVGENNSGKTSVLEAISVLCRPYDPYEWLAMVRRRDFGQLDETRVQSLRWCFSQTGDLVDPDFMYVGKCSFQCQGAFPVRGLEVDYQDVVAEPSERDIERLNRQRNRTGEYSDIERLWRGAQIIHHIWDESQPFDHPADPIIIQIWEEDRMSGVRSRPSSRRSNLDIPVEMLTPYSYQLNRLQVSSHSQQLLFPFLEEYKTGRQSIIELVREFDPDVIDINVASFRGGRPAIYISHKRLGPAPLSVFGDALRRAVLLASTIQKLSGGVLLIDEIETGIHVTALKKVFAWLVKAASRFDVQIIATTHSLEAVDAVCESVNEHVDDLVTFHINQSDETTKVKRIAGEMLLRLRRERGLDVR
jgi:energy-coupling factor transporter ATP-binding protein EcfA2